MPRYTVPNLWRRQMVLLEELDRRMGSLLDSGRRMSPTVRAEIEAWRDLIRPTLVREGRRPPAP